VNFNLCPCSGKTLAKLLQPAALAVLAREPVHGYLIARRLEGLGMFRGQKPDPTGLYRLLKAMEEKGLVSASWDLPEAGPAKRRFSLTAGGRACLARWTRTLQDYRKSIDGLLDLLHGSVRKASCPRRRACAGKARKR
jgi:PadR family transcriptional regulator, regulatory protein PadR